MNENKKHEEMTFQEIKAHLSEKFILELFRKVKISTDLPSFHHQLSKTIWKYQIALRQSNDAKANFQRKEFISLQKSAEHFLKTYDRMLDENIASIGSEILSPRHPEIFSPLSPSSGVSDETHLQFYEENKEAVQMSYKRVKQVFDAVCRINQDFRENGAQFKNTKNKALDECIIDLVWNFETATEESASQNCYYSDSISGYKGRFFDFVLAIFDFFSIDSYHSELALGKRIVRINNRLQVVV